MLTRELLLRPEAEAEIGEALSWYKQQAEGLDSEFLRAVEGCLNAIKRNPLAYPVVHKPVRRALLRKFPYSVFFLYEQTDAEDERIVVLACFHARRNPKQWRVRMM